MGCAHGAPCIAEISAPKCRRGFVEIGLAQLVEAFAEPMNPWLRPAAVGLYNAG